MINLDVPAKFARLVDQAHQAAAEFFRPHSRKYDQAEHTYPRELDMLAALLDGLSASGGGAGAGGVRRGAAASGNQNGANLRLLLGTIEMCWGDVGLLLSMPRQGLGNAAIASVANDEQLARYQGKWAAMAITEPDAGSDSGAIRTTAVLDGDHYVLNGEKIFVTAGERADCVVVWATLDRSLGKAAIKSFVVDRGTPGFTLVRLEHKLGIRASDTAHFRLEDVRVHKDNLLGSPDIQGFAGVMQTFDNTRPLVAAMAVGVARAALEEVHRILVEAGVTIDYDRPAFSQPAAAATYLQLEADWEAAYLLSLEAAWMADNRKPNSLQASIAKAKAGRSASDITLRCVELAGTLGYSENSLLEKWARDSKILDIFEGTQQIQQLIVARRLLGKSSTELR
ncbi:acyl-CoA dehydrogenase family protein [Actinokineospora terrae]|uniref:Acyl-CoA dehydrogenase n=1 Tax=Actinokineospora terrae TaxID=155974 RepID=A0A1H9PGQ3_9PSEU|nr:acyl-CoA dehydrogenase family protein [Actinokineospora terrae]SER47337.1 acyl-CoA dehydrogenase [Actinokineospora terrae]